MGFLETLLTLSYDCSKVYSYFFYFFGGDVWKMEMGDFGRLKHEYEKGGEERGAGEKGSSVWF